MMTSTIMNGRDGAEKWVHASDYVFVYSRREKRYISMYYKIKPDKIRVVNNGFNELNVRKEDFSFNSPLKLGKLIERKKLLIY